MLFVRRFAWVLSAVVLLGGAFLLTGDDLSALSGRFQARSSPPPPTTAVPTAQGQGAGRGAQMPGLPGQRQDFWGTFWQDEAIKKELVLTPRQVRELEKIYSDRLRDVAPFIPEFDKQRNELDRMLAEQTVTVPELQVQIARMEAARAKINETRVVMLYRMSKQLSTDQNKKLQALWEKRIRERSSRGGGSPNQK